jgi:hypothetical protein
MWQNQWYPQNTILARNVTRDPIRCDGALWQGGTLWQQTKIEVFPVEGQDIVLTAQREFDIPAHGGKIDIHIVSPLDQACRCALVIM